MGRERERRRGGRCRERRGEKFRHGRDFAPRRGPARGSLPTRAVFGREAAWGDVAREAAAAVVEPDGDGTIREGFAEDKVEVGVVVEVDGEENGVAGDGETGDVGAAVAVEIGVGPDGGGSPRG